MRDCEPPASSSTASTHEGTSTTNRNRGFTGCIALTLRSVQIKGPGLRIDLDVRRVWKCPQCESIRRTEGSIASVVCDCADGNVQMQLIELPRPLAQPPEALVARYANLPKVVIEEDTEPLAVDANTDGGTPAQIIETEVDATTVDDTTVADTTPASKTAGNGNSGDDPDAASVIDGTGDNPSPEPQKRTRKKKRRGKRGNRKRNTEENAQSAEAPAPTGDASPPPKQPGNEHSRSKKSSPAKAASPGQQPTPPKANADAPAKPARKRERNDDFGAGVDG